MGRGVYIHARDADGQLAGGRAGGQCAPAVGAVVGGVLWPELAHSGHRLLEGGALRLGTRRSLPTRHVMEAARRTVVAVPYAIAAAARCGTTIYFITARERGCF